MKTFFVCSQIVCTGMAVSVCIWLELMSLEKLCSREWNFDTSSDPVLLRIEGLLHECAVVYVLLILFVFGCTGT